jgi:protoporphyrinogen oxidase
VLLTAYPETRRALDYDALDLQPFYDGALVRYGGRFHRIADPFRHPLDAPQTLFAPVGRIADKLRVARLRRTLTHLSLDKVFQRPETTTITALRERWGFSDLMINRFFRPFLGGVFFDRALEASSRMFEFVFKMFAEGQTVLPARGIEAIPQQMAADLPEGMIHFGTTATAIDDQTVRCADGTTYEAPTIVVATDAPAAHALVGDIEPTGGRATTCVYYAAPKSPLDEPVLLLNGDGDGPVNNVSVLSDVAPSYAPGDDALVSAVVVGDPPEDDAAIERAVRRQLMEWFGAAVGGWKHLRTYRVRYALPEQKPPFLSPPVRAEKRRDGLYVCGDHRRTASLNGALASGRSVAEAVLAAPRRAAA